MKIKLSISLLFLLSISYISLKSYKVFKEL